MAIPSIFVSSTYYDLKYIREALKLFIEGYGFQAVLNEYYSVTYNHNQRLDTSCYKEVKKADMLIMIVGGRLGTTMESELEEAYESYSSVSMKEYLTAMNEGIPIYVFVEEGVYTEYNTYQNNKDIQGIQYSQVDNAKIYEFLNKLYENRNQSVFPFKKYTDIISGLRIQWAGLFQDLLAQQKSKKFENEIAKSLNSLNHISEDISSVVQLLMENLVSEVEKDSLKQKQITSELRYLAKEFTLLLDFSWDMGCGKLNFYHNVETTYDRLIRPYVEGKTQCTSMEDLCDYLYNDVEEYEKELSDDCRIDIDQTEYFCTINETDFVDYIRLLERLEIAYDLGDRDESEARFLEYFKWEMYRK